MGTKLGKKAYPAGHGPNDFECFGPVATKDGEFNSCKLADLGCFNQEGSDSNKFYHAAVVKSRKNGKWFAYFQWGRTGSAGDYQFSECDSEVEAQEAFATQLHAKNDKRGQWVNKPGLGNVLQAKPGKDCYLVRPLATRSAGSPGLPDACRIAMNDGAKVTKVAKVTTTKSTTKKSSFDPQTVQLMRDLNVGTVAFTKSAIQGGTIPMQSSIDFARNILLQAQRRIAVVGNTLTTQVQDKELRDLTYMLYSRVPKVKVVGAPESTWILSQDNILMWQNDLDAFETALYASNIAEPESDPFGGMSIEMSWMPPPTFIHEWMPDATRNVHGGMGRLKIKNVWMVNRLGVKDGFVRTVKSIGADRVNFTETPGQQPRKRSDLDTDEGKLFRSANVGLLFHGTQTVNVPGILREGLRLPKELPSSVITGAMFGGGHYWASDFKKSAGYTSLSGGYWSGGRGKVRNREAFMFIADVALGKAHVAKGPYGYTKPPDGCHCVLGKANVSGVQNDEWITFNKTQYQFRYLVEFTV